MANEKIATALKWGIGLLTVAVAAPVIMLTVKGLIGLAIAGVLGLVMVNGAPVLSQVLANWKLKGIKMAAAKNPVEQLQNIYIERKEALTTFATRVTEFATQVRQFEDKMSVFAAQYPTEAPKFKAQLDAMNKLLTIRRQRYEDVKMQLQRFDAEVKKADAIWQMSQAAAELNKAAGMEDEDVFAKIKAETAVDSIQLSLNKSFAELEMALLEEGKSAQPSLAAPSTPVTVMPVTTGPVAVGGRVRPLS